MSAAMSPLRLFVIGIGLLLVLSGFALIAVGGYMAAVGLWLVVGGLVIVGGTLLERRRYRSGMAEAGAKRTGPGGGEPLDERLPSRFRPTEERFVDPTTGVTMRVWVDSVSGERRYRADR